MTRKYNDTCACVFLSLTTWSPWKWSWHSPNLVVILNDMESSPVLIIKLSNSLLTLWSVHLHGPACFTHIDLITTMAWDFINHSFLLIFTLIKVCQMVLMSLKTTVHVVMDLQLFSIFSERPVTYGRQSTCPQVSSIFWGDVEVAEFWFGSSYFFRIGSMTVGKPFIWKVLCKCCNFSCCLSGSQMLHVWFWGNWPCWKNPGVVVGSKIEVSVCVSFCSAQW